MLYFKYIYKAIIIIALLLTTIFSSFSLPKSITIDFEIDNPEKFHGGQLFYHTSSDVFKSINLSYRNNKVSVTLYDANHIKDLRFDPMGQTGSISVKNLHINGERIAWENLTLTPLNHIKEIQIINDYDFKIHSIGDDPFLILTSGICAQYNQNTLTINYLYLAIGIFILFFYLLNIKKDNQKRNNTRLLISDTTLYITIFFILLTTAYIFKLRFDITFTDYFSSIYAPTILFFKKLILEFSITLLLIIILLNTKKTSHLLAKIIISAYISINFIQLNSVLISGEFLSNLALDNTEFFNLILNTENYKTVITSFLYLIVLPYILLHIFRRHSSQHIHPPSPLIYTFLLGSILLNTNTILSSTRTTSNLDKLKSINHLKGIDPLHSFINLYLPDFNEEVSFSKNEILQLQKLGYKLDYTAEYPLMKKSIYNNNKFKHALNYNVILIFSEGLSSRTIGLYNDKFEDLTPNLDLFSRNKNTMIVNNYYNHTAATYRGIQGGLCSMYPFFGGAKGWDESENIQPERNYKCLPHILNNNGYETIYLGTNYENVSNHATMVKNFGFSEIISPTFLAQNYIPNFIKKRKSILTDQQAYSALTNFIKEKNQTKPFFITMYTPETHAFVESKDIRFKDGKSNGLNTIHNMDNAFGKFWQYFRSSSFFDNTILIFTTDHAHFPENSFIKAMNNYDEHDYQNVFVDKIPLLIYNPDHKANKPLDAHSSTSTSLAPTLINILGLPNEKNAFIGKSLFDNKTNIGIAAFGNSTYIIKDGKVFDNFNTKPKDMRLQKLAHKFMTFLHNIEVSNRMITD